MKKQLVFAFFSVLFLFVSTAFNQSYQAEMATGSYVSQNNTGRYEGGIAINNNGNIIGVYSILSSDPPYFGGFIYSPPVLLGATGSASPALLRMGDINDNDIGVGGCGIISSGSSNGNFIPCKWNNSGSASSIGFINGYGNGEAISINNSGEVVGYLTRRNNSSENKPTRGFIWDSSNGMRLIDSFSGGISVAISINDSGQVVGYSDDQAFIWDAQNGIRPISSLIGNSGGWTFKYALKINNNAQIIGRGNFNGAERNFFWDGISIHDLGSTDDYEIYGLNDLGQIVGKFNNNGSNQAFIWDENSSWQNLNNFVSVDGWVWQRANDINNHGQVSVNGHNETLGIDRTWIFTPEKEPLIFIPGVAGSTLYEADENGDPITTNCYICEIWTNGLFDPFNVTLPKLFLDPQAEPHSEIVAVDVVRNVALNYTVYEPLLTKLTEDGRYKEYKIQGNPKKLVVGLSGCDGSERYDGQKPNLFVFPYDWRQTNVETANQLKQYIDCVQLFYPNKKVNILTHSMGGLVARRYILDYQSDHKVNKLITIAAPFLGAPKAINALITGRFLDIAGYNVYQNTIKGIVSYSKGVHELLPSKWYYDLDERPFGAKSLVLGLITEYSYEEANARLNSKFASGPYNTSNEFHSYPYGNRLQDNWSLDSSGVRYYHIYGVQSWDGTIGQILEEPFIDYPLIGGEGKYSVETKYTKGDGTVPVVSTSRAREGSSSVLLAPNTVVKSCTSPSITEDKNYEHNGITKNPIIWDEIQAMLDNYYVNHPECTIENSQSRIENVSQKTTSTHEELTNNALVNYLKVYGVDRLQITDEVGNTNSQVGYGTDEVVPEVDYEYGSNPSEPSIVPHKVTFVAGKALDIKFTAPAGKLRIELFKGVSHKNTVEAIKYLDLQLPVNVTAWLKFTTAGVENLRYDADGDGTFETEVQPTLILTGAAANDKNAPIINVSYIVNNNVATMTVNATDNETGISQVRYIVDGENNDHIYTSSFSVNLTRTQLIYISAQDNAGNRSLIVKWLDFIPPTTTISQTPPFNTAGWSNSDTILELKAVDDLGGSGIETFTFSGDGAQSIAEETLRIKQDPLTFPKPSSSADFLTKTFNFYKEGITSLTFFAKDRVGNIETTRNYTVKIDKSLPISRHIATTDGQQTTFNLTATDMVSGVSEIIYSIDGGTAQTYTAPFSVSNTGGHYINYYARDIAGNEETPRTIYINSAQVPKSILISEFRTRGYLGADDEFIELYNNGETAVDISNWIISVKQGSGATPVTLATINNGTILPARGHYLLRKAGANNFSLSGYAEADQTYAGAIGDNCGIAIVSSSSVIIDAVGFSSVTDPLYREGAGLAPSTGITVNGQYSFIRNYTRGSILIDSNNNRADFIFVATDGGTYNNLKAVVGSPGPENLSSPIYKEGDVLITQIDNNVTLAESPNRFYDYTATSSQYPVGILSVRRKITNNTGKTLTAFKIRITAVTTKNSAVTLPQQAVLRLINSSDITVTSVDGLRTYPLKGLTLENVPTTIDGGLNSSLQLNLGSNGLSNGESLNINLKAGIVTNGQYKLDFRIEAPAINP